MRRSSDVYSFQDIDLPAYSDRFRRYIERIESRLGKRIRFLDLASDPSREPRTTHANIQFCKECFPAVWVDLTQLEGARNQKELLAHEATHIELAMVDGYTLVGYHEVCLSELQREMIHAVHIMLTDLVVDTRLKEFGFDRSEEFEHQMKVAIQQERECFVPPWPPVGPREFRCALYLAGTLLSPWCKSHHESRLREVYRRKREKALERADRIIGVVKSTPKILEPEGQWSALTKILAMFGLDKGIFPHDP